MAQGMPPKRSGRCADSKSPEQCRAATAACCCHYRSRSAAPRNFAISAPPVACEANAACPQSSAAAPAPAQQATAQRRKAADAAPAAAGLFPARAKTPGDDRITRDSVIRLNKAYSSKPAHEHERATVYSELPFSFRKSLPELRLSDALPIWPSLLNGLSFSMIRESAKRDKTNDACVRT